MSDENKAVVRRVVGEHWNKKKLALAAELFTTKITVHSPDGEWHGQEGYAQPYDSYLTAFPEFKVNTDEMIADGNKVVLRYTFTGTHQGPLASIPASGRKVTVPAVAIFRLARGRVDELHFFWDRLALMQQIGALSASAQAGGR
jgi:steroid delta-isomerase-like uncharacterized protein